MHMVTDSFGIVVFSGVFPRFFRLYLRVFRFWRRVGVFSMEIRYFPLVFTRFFRYISFKITVQMLRLCLARSCYGIERLGGVGRARTCLVVCILDLFWFGGLWKFWNSLWCKGGEVLGVFLCFFLPGEFFFRGFKCDCLVLGRVSWMGRYGEYCCLGLTDAYSPCGADGLFQTCFVPCVPLAWHPYV